VRPHKEKAQRRLKPIARKLTGIEGQAVDEQHVASALSAFGPVWDELFQAEKERIVRLVIERVDCDGTERNLIITLRNAGLGGLAQEMGPRM